MARALIVWRVVGLGRESVLVVASTLFVVAALATAGVIDSLYGLSEEMVTPSSGPSQYYVVITSYSVAPFTSVVMERFIEERLAGVRGVVGVVYEVLAPVVLNGSVYILRGVDPADLSVVAGNYSVVGRGFTSNCFGCVWVGESLARELRLGPNDTVILHSPLASSDFVLRVEGVLVTDSVLRYEFVTNVGMAEAVRGVGQSTYSLAVIFVDGPDSLARVAEAFNVSLAGRGLLERALLAIRFAGHRLKPYFLESLSDLYLSRFGLSRDLLASLLVATLAVLGVGFYVLGQAVTSYATGRLALLHELGLSTRYLRVCVAGLGVLLTVLGGAAGLVIAHALFPWIGLVVLGYVRHPVIDYSFFTASVGIASALVAAGSASVEVGDGG